jgi:hypothetical protein
LLPLSSPSRSEEIASRVVAGAANIDEEDEEEKEKKTTPTHPPNSSRTTTTTSKVRATKSRNPNQRADWWWDAQIAVCRIVIGSAQHL